MENVSDTLSQSEDLEGQMKQMTVLRTEYAQLKSQMGNSEEPKTEQLNSIAEIPQVVEKKINLREKLVTFFKNKSSHKSSGSKSDNSEQTHNEAGPSEATSGKKQNSSLDNELEMAKSHIEDLKLQLESQEAEMLKMLDENRKLSLENEQIRADLIFKQNDVNILSQAHSELDNDLKAKEEELDQLKVEHQNIKGELELKVKMFNQMVVEMDQLQGDKANLMTEVQTLRGNVDERLVILQNDNENLQEEVKRANEELVRIQKQMEQAVVELRHQREKVSLEGKISIIHNHNRALMSERVSLESENSSLKRQLEEMLQQTHQTSSEMLQPMDAEQTFDIEEEFTSKNNTTEDSGELEHKDQN